MNNMKQQLNFILNKIAQAEKESNHAQKVKILAVSKKQSVQAIKDLYHLGVHRFGENYVNEAIEKQKQLAEYADISWHFIGHLQSNKIKQVAQHFDWVQSIDNVDKAKKLNQFKKQIGGAINVCIQVNISNESSKSGVNVDLVLPLAEQILEFPFLKLRGIMAIPAPPTSNDDTIQSFIELKKIFNQLQAQFNLPYIDTLSMGMSSDFELAINHGSTMIRIGTALFGLRQ